MKRFALIGHPIGHSLSPVLHNYLLKRLAVRGRYDLRDVEQAQLASTLEEFKLSGLTGFNVTIPHKRNILPWLTCVCGPAAQIRAVNTVLIVHGELHGHNTDGIGFINSLENKGIDVQGMSALVFGAGGAARASAHALLDRGLSELCIANRNRKRGVALVQELLEMAPQRRINVIEWNREKMAECAQHCQLVVNATPIGMWPEIEQSPFKLTFDAGGLIVCDLIYNPLRTKFLREAARQGAVTIDGLDMFIFQAIEALRIWLERDFEFDLTDLRNLLTVELSVYEKS